MLHLLQALAERSIFNNLAYAGGTDRPMKVETDTSLKPYNTFGIGAKASFLAEIHTEADLQALYSTSLVDEVPVLVLGGGSNVLFTRDYAGLVVHMASRGIAVEEAEEGVLVHAQAGENWNTLVQFCIRQGYAGIENLSLIPGSAGASPVQNIGAYGVELKDTFFELRAFEISTRTFRTFNKADCCFSYRESIFKKELRGKFIITRLSLQLSLKADLHITYGAITQELDRRGIVNPDIADIGRIVSAIRVAKLPDPSTIGSAGSFFKNPVISSALFDKLVTQFPAIVCYPAGPDHVKLAAGWLIEQCGWKGKVVGSTGTWKNQALVLVNHGGATGDEILKLGNEITASVLSRFGVVIESEVNIIG